MISVLKIVREPALPVHLSCAAGSAEYRERVAGERQTEIESETERKRRRQSDRDREGQRDREADQETARQKQTNLQTKRLTD